MGKVYSERLANTYALIDVMKKAFRSKGKLSARDWGGGLVFFSFERAEDREWVLNNQPWHFDGALFAIRALSGKEQPSSIVLNTVSLWTRAHDIPMNFRSDCVIRSIANKIGTLECYEKCSDTDPSEYVRFKIQIDFKNPWCRG